MRRGVKYHAIDALCEPVVRDLFQCVGRFVTAAGERLGGHQALAVRVGRRCRAADVHVIHRLRMQRVHPELAHRDVDLALVEQRVFENLQRHAGRFGISAQALAVQQFGQQAEMVVGEHVGQRAAKIPQEPVADCGALHHAAGQCRQIRCRIVTAALAEFRNHIVGPILHAGFPTVDQNVLQALAVKRSQAPLDRIEVAVEVRFHVLAAQLIGLVAQSGGHRRAVLRAR